MKRRNVLHASIGLAVCGSCGALAAARQFRLLQMVPMSGPAGAVGKELAAGADLYMRSAEMRTTMGSNSVIELKTIEDPRTTQRSFDTLKDEVDRYRPVAVLHAMNADFNKKLIESGYLREQTMPVIGAWTGATSIRSRADPHLFFTRTGLKGESQRMLVHAATIGMSRGAVCYQNDGFGQDALAQVKTFSKQYGIVLVGEFPQPRLGPGASETEIYKSMQPAITGIARSKPQIVFYFGSSSQCSEIVRHTRGAVGARVTILSASTVDANEIVRLVGAESARGVGIVQVLPHSGIPSCRLVRDYQRAGREAFGETWRPSQFSLEGFLNAKLATEAIRRAKGRAEADAVLQALSTITNWDMGGVSLDFSGGRREGARYSTIAVIGPGGRLMY